MEKFYRVLAHKIRKKNIKKFLKNILFFIAPDNVYGII
jgi:hypothetical protein